MTVAAQGAAPGDVDDKHGGDVGEQGQAQPLQEAGVAVVRQERFQRNRADREQGGVQQGRAADQELDRRPHRPDVRAQVDDVGDQDQQPTMPYISRGGVVLAEVARDAPARDAPDLGADLLDARHQRVREQHGPEQPIAELRPDLGVRRDAAGVVVGRPRDQPRPQRLEQPLFGDALGRRLLARIAGLDEFPLPRGLWPLPERPCFVLVSPAAVRVASKSIIRGRKDAPACSLCWFSSPGIASSQTPEGSATVLVLLRPQREAVNDAAVGPEDGAGDARAVHVQADGVVDQGVVVGVAQGTAQLSTSLTNTSPGMAICEFSGRYGGAPPPPVTT